MCSFCTPRQQLQVNSGVQVGISMQINHMLMIVDSQESWYIDVVVCSYASSCQLWMRGLTIGTVGSPVRRLGPESFKFLACICVSYHIPTKAVPFGMGKLTINGHVQSLCLFTRWYMKIIYPSYHHISPNCVCLK